MRSLTRVLALIVFGAPIVTASEWKDPLDPVVITTEAIASGRLPVLRVVHDVGPGGWQFYDDVEELSSPVVLEKAKLLKLDPSLRAVIDLPERWQAERASPEHSWSRSRIEGDGG